MISKQQRIAGIVLMLLGAYVTYYALFELNIGTVREPGSGFFTLICGAGILLLSTILVVLSFKNGVEDRPLWEKGGWKKPLLAIVVILAYVLLIPRLGFILSTALFLLVWGFIVDRGSVLRTVLMTVIGCVCMWVLFEKLLRVPLPNGILPW